MKGVSMSDLISRSALIEVLEKYKFGAISSEVEREFIKDTVIGFVKDQPSAYDVEAVVESIEALPAQDLLGVAHLPRTATINRIKRGGKCELPEM